MDKNTLSNYGWIVIAVLVLSVMIALATPFGEYIKAGVESTTAGLFDTSEKALNVVGMSAKTDETEKATASGSYISVNDVASKQHNLKVNLSSDTVTDFSGVTVTKTGKNLLDMSTVYKYHTSKDNSVNAQIDATSNSVKLIKTTGASTQHGLSFRVYLPANTYTLSCGSCSNYGSTVYVFDSAYKDCATLSGHTQHKTGTTFTITQGGYYTIAFFNSYSASENDEVEFNNCQLEIGDTKTEFEPYTKQTVTASADGTVSGLKSVSPNMTIIADSDVKITCEYQKKN